MELSIASTSELGSPAGKIKQVIVLLELAYDDMIHDSDYVMYDVYRLLNEALKELEKKDG